MATVRAKVMKKGVPQSGRSGEIVPVEINWEEIAPKTRLLEIVEEVTEKVRLAEADVIVTGGRGLQEEKHFALIRELAELLDAAVGASRGAVDAGWISYAHQVDRPEKPWPPNCTLPSGFRCGSAPGGNAILRHHCGH